MKNSTNIEKNLGFAERFLEAFDGASIADITRRTGKTYQAIKNYAAGRVPTGDILVDFSNMTGCSIDWLLTGKGEKFLSTATNVPKKLATKLRLVDTAPASSTDALDSLQQLYDQLPSEEDRRAIDELLAVVRREMEGRIKQATEDQNSQHFI